MEHLALHPHDFAEGGKFYKDIRYKPEFGGAERVQQSRRVVEEALALHNKSLPASRQFDHVTKDNIHGVLEQLKHTESWHGLHSTQPHLEHALREHFGIEHPDAN